ncbi:hypothetical protein [Ewingella americana]|nr:hypothetical protein [Ewingella americana]
MRYTIYSLALLSVLLVSGFVIEALADMSYHEMKEKALMIVNLR